MSEGTREGDLYEFQNNTLYLSYTCRNVSFAVSSMSHSSTHTAFYMWLVLDYNTIFIIIPCTSLQVGHVVSPYLVMTCTVHTHLSMWYDQYI